MAMLLDGYGAAGGGRGAARDAEDREGEPPATEVDDERAAIERSGRVHGDLLGRVSDRYRVAYAPHRSPDAAGQLSMHRGPNGGRVRAVCHGAPLCDHRWSMGQQHEEIADAASADRARKPPGRHGGDRGSGRERSSRAARCRSRRREGRRHAGPTGLRRLRVGAGVYMGSWVKEGTVFSTDIPRPSPECRSGCSGAAGLARVLEGGRGRRSRSSALGPATTRQRWPSQDRRACRHRPAEGAPRLPGRVRSERLPKVAARAGCQVDARRKGRPPGGRLPGVAGDRAVGARDREPAQGARRCGLSARGADTGRRGR